MTTATKAETNKIIAYRDKIRGGRQGCEDIAIAGNKAGRKYFQCPFLSDVVVHSNECLFYFRFSTWEQKWSYSIYAELPVDVGDCLKVAKNENKDVKAGLVSLDADRIATVKCSIVKNSDRQTSKVNILLSGMQRIASTFFKSKIKNQKEVLGEYGEYRFNWDGIYDEISTKRNVKHSDKNQIVQTIGQGAKQTDKYSVVWANKLCASFALRWKSTKDQLTSRQIQKPILA